MKLVHLSEPQITHEIAMYSFDILLVLEFYFNNFAIFGTEISFVSLNN